MEPRRRVIFKRWKKRNLQRRLTKTVREVSRVRKRMGSQKTFQVRELS